MNLPSTVLREIWRHWVDWVTSAKDLQVYQHLGGNGKPYWQAYNPETGTSTCSGSEREIQAWIEQQHYQFSNDDKLNSRYW